MIDFIIYFTNRPKYVEEQQICTLFPAVQFKLQLLVPFRPVGMSRHEQH